MSKMDWHSVSVYQFQQLEQLKTDDNFEAIVKVVAIIYNLTEKQVDAMPMNEFNKKCKEIEFIYKEQLPSKTCKYIKANGNVYRFIPDIREIRVGGTGRYITTKYFQRDVVQNLHRIAASMVMPQKKSWFGYRDLKYQDQDHDIYAEDLLSASIVEVYGMVVFFCKVYLNWMDNSKDYLESLLKAAKMSQSESEKVVNDLWTLMAGSIKQQLLPNTKE
jgi:hypothetical protein